MTYTFYLVEYCHFPDVSRSSRTQKHESVLFANSGDSLMIRQIRNGRIGLFRAGLLLLLLSGPICHSSLAAPKILLIVTDDQRPDAIHALGNPQIRTKRWKSVTDPLIQREQLFDLAADSFELKNLVQQPEYANTVAELRTRLCHWERAEKQPSARSFTRGCHGQHVHAHLSSGTADLGIYKSSVRGQSPFGASMWLANREHERGSRRR